MSDENNASATSPPVVTVTKSRKASRPHRFSIDYYGFPRINDDSDDSNPDADGGEKKMSFGNMDQVRGNRALQYLATFAANMGALAFGTALSYPSTALPSLRADEYFKTVMTEKDETWIGSVFALGAVMSGPAAGFAIERMGRRMSMLVLSVPFFLSWMLISIASDIPMIIIGRFLTGFFSGVFLIAAPIFTAEISDVSIRGAVGATFDMSSSVGILFIYIVGAYSSWRTQALICAAVPLFVFILMLFVPESPAFLLEKGNPEMAKESLIKYKGAKNNHEYILATLEMPVLVPVSISFMVFVFQVICGLDPILIYTVDIFKSAGGGAVDEYSSTVIFGVIELIAGIMAAFFVDRTGRRFLLLVSEAVMVLSLASLGIFFFLRGSTLPITPTGVPANVDESFIAWLPLTSLSIYILAYSIGLGPVGYLLMGEILPLRVKGLAGCLLTSGKWLLSFVVTKFFADIISLIGESGCYWLFAGFCCLGFVYIFFFVPETNGKTLEDIQRTFRRRYSMEDVSSEGSPLLRRPQASLNTALESGSNEKDSSDKAKHGYQSINTV
ncbi:Facilitated trehalose transporter Tret1 [Orchesella cincta]|uniref:Facilitated trehalose transporter Tret1 n=1 Tax=Orchesella cincta TaxID=48709 RepID=A0A1D2N470_ORCCI|nr:Facilitated trehalose transporter Tret1 [Orchesella cincta]